MRETTGAVFDTLAQIHLIHGNHEEAGRCLLRAREAYGDAEPVYHWSVQTLEARVALRPRRSRHGARDRDPDRARRWRAAGLRDAGGTDRGRGPAGVQKPSEAEHRLDAVSASVSAAGMSSTWGEFLRLRGRVQAMANRPTDAYHDLGQSVKRLRPPRRALPGWPELSGAWQARRRGGARGHACQPLSGRCAGHFRIARRDAGLERDAGGPCGPPGRRRRRSPGRRSRATRPWSSASSPRP